MAQHWVVIGVETGVFWPTIETAIEFDGHQITLRPETAEHYSSRYLLDYAGMQSGVRVFHRLSANSVTSETMEFTDVLTSILIFNLILLLVLSIVFSRIMMRRLLTLAQILQTVLVAAIFLGLGLISAVMEGDLWTDALLMRTTSFGQVMTPSGYALLIGLIFSSIVVRTGLVKPTADAAPARPKVRTLRAFLSRYAFWLVVMCIGLLVYFWPAIDH